MTLDLVFPPILHHESDMTETSEAGKVQSDKAHRSFISFSRLQRAKQVVKEEVLMTLGTTADLAAKILQT